MSRFGIPAALAAVFILTPHPTRNSTVQGCAVAPPRGQHVDIAQESAIIIWDSGTKTEQFIRRASFRTEAKDFGFLVPTPTKPTLAEADDSAFDELERITAPPIRTAAQSSPGCGIGCSAQRAMVRGAKVDVLHEQRVAGYDAAVLSANDAAALNKWLGDHGYQSSDVLKKWLEPYVTKGWIITAFKIASPDAMGPEAKDAATTGDRPPVAGISTRALRLTFTTDRPFYPYREPEDQRDAEASKAPRLLRVYFVGTERIEGTVGEGKTFHGQTRSSKILPDDERQSLISILKLTNEKSPATWWLTEFEDRSSPRPGTDDLFFHTAKDQSTVERTAMTYPGRHGPPSWSMFAVVLAVIALVYFQRIVRPRSRLQCCTT